MKKVVALSFIVLCFTSRSFAQADYFVPSEAAWKFGFGYQLSGSNLLLASWQSPDQNKYGQSWRIEPMIGGSYLASEGSTTSSTASLTLGLGAYLRWRVRAPFDDLYFLVGPRLSATATRTTSQSISDPDTLPRIDRSSQYISSSLGFLFGPEYAIDKWQQHFSIAGFFVLSGSITGRAKETPNDYSISTWNFAISTGTGIVLRYYFR